VLGAKVEVMTVHPASNGCILHKKEFELLDTGSGGERVCRNTSPDFHYVSGV
jgi:hypothetical protein